MIEGPVTAMCPASALQFHRRTTVVLDEAAAGLLCNRSHYRWVEQNTLDWQRYD
jgi:glucosamine-6-phosphate deaminase